MIRVKTRITERIDTPYFKSPIILPEKCIFTQRLIEYYHCVNYHAGTQILLSIIREKFWIVRGRKAIRNIVKSCIKCKRYTAKVHFTEPVSLPEDRVKDAYVFEVVGVDLAGLLYIKKGSKTWVVLFTCAIYHAVHLELVTSLSTDSFLLAFRRFVARRGRPRKMYSDNGTNFKGAYNDLNEIDWDKVLREAELHHINWKFNPPSAAWWGGFWERLIRTLKDLLKRTLGGAVLTYEELQTVLCDIKSIMNSRPLTYLSEDSTDLKPLTPAMFLLDNSETKVIDIDMVDAQHCRKRIRYRIQLIESLRKRFRKEYLGQLILKQNLKGKNIDISVGEVVLIGDDFKKRLNWPLARVIELIPGKDGKVRTKRAKTPISLAANQNMKDQNADKMLPSVPADVKPEQSSAQVTRYGRSIK
ncbi:uncharacterized protein, partial [Parasteatoda tepidariorum]|uniref:uncharacterized protein n=1 Tax=Parasteatoda tepidariorum TaxID=114398 RepID=UPI0039BC3D03